MASTDIKKQCIEGACGHVEYVITAGEKEFYESKEMQLPKRCPECRARRKREKERAQ